MAWAPDYCQLAELKSWLRINDTADDALLAMAITAASRDIDQHCGRQFGALDAAQTRYYAWSGEWLEGRPAITIDDVMVTTDLAVQALDADGAASGSPLVLDAGYRLWPFNAPAKGRPWTHMLGWTGTTWSRRGRSLSVTARWGWSAVPVSVRQACLLVAAETFTRRNAPFGIAGSPDLGSELRLLRRLDVDAARLLTGYRRLWAAA